MIVLFLVLGTRGRDYKVELHVLLDSAIFEGTPYCLACLFSITQCDKRLITEYIGAMDELRI